MKHEPAMKISKKVRKMVRTAFCFTSEIATKSILHKSMLGEGGRLSSSDGGVIDTLYTYIVSRVFRIRPMAQISPPKCFEPEPKRFNFI